VNGVATDHEGNVYVADLGNNRIQKFTNSGAYLTQWGSSGIGDGQFDRPFALATDGAGNVYVCDYNNGRVQKFTSTGTFLAQLGQYGSFYNPTDVATDADGNVYVAESINCRIQKFTGTGAYLAQWGTQGSGNGEFFTPFGITVNAAGDVYVVDTGNNRIQKFATPHVSVDLALPGTINVRSMGKWVTAYLQPPAGFDASAIDASSIRLFGNLGARPLAVDATSPSAIGDQNGDGVPDLMVKFDRGAFDLTVFGTSAQVAVNGMIAGQAFGGVATIKVLRSEIIPPPRGVAYAGMVTTMRW